MRNVSERIRELRGIALRKREWVSLYVSGGAIVADWGGAWAPRADPQRVPFAVVSPDGEIYERSHALELAAGDD